MDENKLNERLLKIQSSMLCDLIDLIPRSHHAEFLQNDYSHLCSELRDIFNEIQSIVEKWTG